MPTATSQPTRRRSYRSVVREQRARETRARILAAASAEFVRAGYSATTIRAVADRAGVSVPTVELLFGTKPRLLRAAISFTIRGDAGDIPMLEREWAARAQGAGSVAEFLTIVGSVLTEASRRSAGLVMAAFEAEHLDESMRALADQLRAQRVETAAWIVDGLIERSPLHADIDRDEALDTVWLLMDPHGFRALTQHRGWTAEQFRQWFIASVGRLMLAEPDAAQAIDRDPPRAAANRSTKPRTSRRRPT